MNQRRAGVMIALAAGGAALLGCPSGGSGGAGSDAGQVPGGGGSGGAAMDGSAGTGASDAGSADAATGDAGAADTMVVCPDDAVDASSFALGMPVMGDNQKIQAKLIAAMPTPPARYNNDWTIEFMDASGNALSDVDLTKAYADMPYHGHGKAATSMTKLSDPGQFDVGINLFMRGYFDVQFSVSSPSAGDDMLHFKYCVR